MTPDEWEVAKLALQAVIALGALLAGILAWRTKKAIQEVHVSLNSRLSQLLEMTATASRAEGRASVTNGGDVRHFPAGPAGIQGPIGPQGQVGPAGPPGEAP